MASLAFTAGSTLLKGVGGFQGDNYQADRLKRAAEYGELKAVQTSGQLTEKLNQTLGNIDVVRAAAHDDPTSPTGAAVRDYQEFVGTRQRDIAVGNIRAQAEQDESDAAYMRHAGSMALLGGVIGAGGDIFKAFGPASANPLFGKG